MCRYHQQLFSIGQESGHKKARQIEAYSLILKNHIMLQLGICQVRPSRARLQPKTSRHALLSICHHKKKMDLLRRQRVQREPAVYAELGVHLLPWYLRKKLFGMCKGK